MTSITHTPLPIRIRPMSFDEVIGQDEALAPGSVIRRIIDTNSPAISIILYAPPASGKTTIARIMSHTSGMHFVELSATQAKVTDVRSTITTAEKHLHHDGTPTIVFIDEIHRFSKAQQDILLPAVEAGTIRLVGATTENPSFSVNSALLSRSVLVTLNPLNDANIVAILKRALDHPDGLPHLTLGTDISEDVLQAIAMNASGDARQALTILETLDAARGSDPLTLELLRTIAPHALQRYDRDGDQHYDIISAFIKSMRGSDPDAAIYYLARMIAAGEDPRFIARRLIVHASEDVGLADPSVLSLAIATAHAVQLIGMPEARINLAEATIAIATAPKSNAAYAAIDKALECVNNGGTYPVPKHLRDAHYPGAAALGHGKEYLYPHDYAHNWVPQNYLPPELHRTHFYEPTMNGTEERITYTLSKTRDAM